MLLNFLGLVLNVDKITRGRYITYHDPSLLKDTLNTGYRYQCQSVEVANPSVKPALKVEEWLTPEEKYPAAGTPHFTTKRVLQEAKIHGNFICRLCFFPRR